MHGHLSSGEVLIISVVLRKDSKMRHEPKRLLIKLIYWRTVRRFMDIPPEWDLVTRCHQTSAVRS